MSTSSATAVQRAAAHERADDAVWRALAEPRRRAILRLVAHEERAAGEIANEFEVTRTAVSQHLTALKEAGLVTERRDGTRRLYTARHEGLAALRILLNDIWVTSLDAGRALVEADALALDEADDTEDADGAKDADDT